MASRDLRDLDPEVEEAAREFLASAEREGIDLVVTCTARGLEEQGTLYKSGRTLHEWDRKAKELSDRGLTLCALYQRVAPLPKPGGQKVTKAGAGESWHNWGRALDVVPRRDGQLVWGTSGEDGELWARIGRLGELAGLSWGGRWERFRDFPHFELLPPGKRVWQVAREYEMRMRAEYGMRG